MTWNALWYLLFPLNRMLPESDRYSETHIVLLVSVITTVWFMHWVCGTIGQICETCDIWCLKIKPEELKRKKRQ